MKETDIVQALRCCAEGECKDCAMHEDKQRCQENLLDKAAEDIERLTAENAALREKVPLTEDAMINLAAQALGVEPSRLRELAEADKDGRCVVLPCKVGDHVWADGREAIVVWFFGYKTERYLHAQFLDNAEYTDIPFCEIGKTVFLTKKEAEMAQKGDSE